MSVSPENHLEFAVFVYLVVSIFIFPYNHSYLSNKTICFIITFQIDFFLFSRTGTSVCHIGISPSLLASWHSQQEGKSYVTPFVKIGLAV